jgi:hypothetical protein
MATGRYTSDLEAGDRLGPIEVTISAFQVREYCHANELHQGFLQNPAAPIVPPTMAHLEKLRIYAMFCPEGCGPNARVHYTFDAAWHAPILAGEALRVEGLVARRYLKRGREYIEMRISISGADGGLRVEYTDTVCLSYREATVEDAA